MCPRLKSNSTYPKQFYSVRNRRSISNDEYKFTICAHTHTHTHAHKHTHTHTHTHTHAHTHNLTPWSESASELYRPSDLRLSAKWVPTFTDRGVPRYQRDGSLRPYSRFSRQEPLLFYQVAPQLYSRGWVNPVPDALLFFFLVVPGIEPGPPDL
jgi:hypothetical protein